MNLPTDEVLHELRKADAGLLAEEMTGKSYKEDEETSGLMAGLHMMLGQAKRNAFASVDDTYWGMPFDDLYRIALGEGFKELARFNVNRHKYGTKEIEDVDIRVIMYSSDGFYLNVDSYGTGRKEAPTVNAACLTYNARLNDEPGRAILDNAVAGDKWEAQNPDWWHIRDQRPHLTTPEQDEMWKQYISTVQGNSAWNVEEWAIFALATDRQNSEGLRLTLAELRKQSCWTILPKLVAWEWFSEGFRGAPCLGYERNPEDDLPKELRMDDQEWFEIVLKALPEEHQYLRDLPVREDVNNYDKKRKEIKRK